MRTIIITSDINAHCSQQVIKRLLYLNTLDPKAVIKLYLRTEGGWEADAYSIIDIMQSIGAPVEVHAMGDVFSSGLMLLAAATGKRYIYENTLLGFHALENNESALVTKRYNHFWKKFTELPTSLTSLRNGEMEYLNAKQALEYKIADDIIEN
jgi:ATP-dependent protease ClpP protease subunit